MDCWYEWEVGGCGWEVSVRFEVVSDDGYLILLSDFICNSIYL